MAYHSIKRAYFAVLFCSLRFLAAVPGHSALSRKPLSCQPAVFSEPDSKSNSSSGSNNNYQRKFLLLNNGSQAPMAAVVRQQPAQNQLDASKFGLVAQASAGRLLSRRSKKKRIDRSRSGANEKASNCFAIVSTS